MKLVFIGLSKAGKTSIIKKFFLSYSLKELQNIRPTIFKEETTTHIQGLDEPVFVLDLGGQESYLAKHTEQKNFKDIDLIIFVVDTLDISRIEKTEKYFAEVLTTLRNMNSKALISILLHKYDPEARQSLKENLAKYYQFITKIFQDIKPIINLTSIYDDTSNIALIRLILKLAHFSVIKLGLEGLSTELLTIDHESQKTEALQYLSEKGRNYGLSIRAACFKQILLGELDKNPVTGNIKSDLQKNPLDDTISLNIYLEAISPSPMYTPAELMTVFMTGFFKPLYCKATVRSSTEKNLILTVEEIIND